MPLDIFPKYCIYDKFYAIILNPSIGHNTVKIEPQHILKGEITGAGYFKIVDGRVHVFGYSSSLGITAKNEDAEIIEMALGLIGKGDTP